MAADEMIGADKFLVDVKVEAEIIVGGLDSEDEVAEDEITMQEQDDLDLVKASFAALCS